jgi:hypothetical protein
VALLQPDHNARWGRMSAHQMLCHLSDSFLAAIGEKYALLSKTLIDPLRAGE